MFCKNCGKEIEDDSKFCRYCGAALAKSEEEAPTPEDEAVKKESAEDETTDKSGCGIAAILIIAVVVVIIGISVALSGTDTKGTSGSSGSSSSSSTGGSFWTPGTRSAKNDDVHLEITTIPGFFISDDFYRLELQAQEKITGLVLEIDFKNESGRVLKTETLNVGKVVPGNRYSFELTQSGMSADDLNTAEKFSWRVKSGTVEED